MKNSRCHIYTVKDLYNLQLRLYRKLSLLTNSKVSSLYYGYDCPKDLDFNINKLSILSKVLDRYKNISYNELYRCLCEEDLQYIIESIITEVGSEKCENYTCKIDDSNLKSWSLSNPSCVSYDSYERYAKEFCGDIGLEITVIEEQCELALAISRDIITEDILIAITAYKEACDLDYKLTRTDEQCKIEWELLVKENNCNIDYNVYRDLVNCNINFDIVKSVYSKGLEIHQNSEGELVLSTPYSSHKLADLVIKNADTNKYLLDYK